MSDDVMRITGVAIKHGDLVICLPKPNRHHHVIKYMVKELGIIPPVGHSDGCQGFYLNDGTYLTRSEARALVVSTGQCLTPDHSVYLFSEDLW